jgi:ATP-dependent helicase/nuclease subunit A
MEFFVPSPKRTKINYGIFLHGILSKIRTKDDVQLAIATALRQGTIDQHELAEVEESINWIVNIDVLHSCFDLRSTLKMEATLFTSDGLERRIDRVAMQGNHIWVIDYKTGVPTTKDEAQVKEYLHLLKAMGWHTLTGYLVYVEQKKWVEVTL